MWVASSRGKGSAANTSTWSSHSKYTTQYGGYNDGAGGHEGLVLGGAGIGEAGEEDIGRS